MPIKFIEIKEQIEEQELEEQVGSPADPKVKAAELFARCRAASTAAHGRCGVISRHITTRVFTLCWQVVYLAVFLVSLIHDIHESTDD